MDSRGRLFVADRGNSRIQIFDQDGKFIDAVEAVRPARAASTSTRTTRSTSIDADSSADDERRGLDEGRPDRQREGRQGYARSCRATRRTTGNGAAGEGVVTDSAGNLYTAENVLRGITKYAPKR